MGGAQETPLLDLLRGISITARGSYDQGDHVTHLVPYGSLAHRAADEIESLRQRVSDLTTGLEACDEQVVALRQQLDSLTAQCEKVVRWKHLMSYNDSYFGEPAGDLKRVVYEIERSMPIKGQ